MKTSCLKKSHSRLCKFILGVNKYASNLASKAELGRYPIVISALLHSIKYWLYLNESPIEKKTVDSLFCLKYIRTVVLFQPLVTICCC